MLDKDKRVLLIGGTGSVGSILVDELIRFGFTNIQVLARDETKHGQLRATSDIYKKIITPVIGDVRNITSLEHSVRNADIIIDAAAMKHVWYCEHYPGEAYQTNVVGVQNLITLCERYGHKTLIYISSDKAANPSTAYGASKMMGERIIRAAAEKNTTCQYGIVRFGNVLFSRNSVLDMVRQGIDKNKTVSLVEEPVSRFVMTKQQASSLVLDAINFAKRGETFIYKMSAVDIRELVAIYIDEYTKKRGVARGEIILRRHILGDMEKLDEELFTIEESKHVKLINNHILCIDWQDSMTGLTTFNPDEASSGKSPKLKHDELRNIIKAEM